MWDYSLFSDFLVKTVFHETGKYNAHVTKSVSNDADWSGNSFFSCFFGESPVNTAFSETPEYNGKMLAAAAFYAGSTISLGQAPYSVIFRI